MLEVTSGVGLQEFVGTSMAGGEAGNEVETETGTFATRRTTGKTNRHNARMLDEFRGVSQGVAEGGNEGVTETRAIGMDVTTGRTFEGLNSQQDMNQMRQLLTQPSPRNSSTQRYAVPAPLRNQIMQAFSSSSSGQASTHGGNPTIENAIMALIMHRINTSPTTAGGVGGGPSASDVISLMNSMNSGGMGGAMGGMGGDMSFMGNGMGSTTDMMSMMGGAVGGMGNHMPSFMTNNVDASTAIGQDMSFSGSGSSFMDTQAGGTQTYIDHNSPTTQATTFDTRTQPTVYDSAAGVTDRTITDWSSSASSQSNVETISSNKFATDMQGSLVVSDQGTVVTNVDVYGGMTTDGPFTSDKTKVSSSFSSQDSTMYNQGTSNVDTTNSLTSVNEHLLEPSTGVTGNVEMPVIISKRVKQSSSTDILADIPVEPTVTVGLGKTSANTDGRVRRVERVSFAEEIPVVDSTNSQSQQSQTLVIKETRTIKSDKKPPLIHGQSFQTETVVLKDTPVMSRENTQTQSISNQTMTNDMKIITTHITSDQSRSSAGVVNTKQNDVPNFIGDRLNVPSKSVTIERTVDSSGQTNDVLNKQILTDDNIGKASKIVTITKTTTFNNINDISSDVQNQAVANDISSNQFNTRTETLNTVQADGVITDFAAPGVIDTQTTGTDVGGFVDQTNSLQTGVENTGTLQVSSQSLKEGFANEVNFGQVNAVDSTVTGIEQVEPSTKKTVHMTINASERSLQIDQSSSIAPVPTRHLPVKTVSQVDTAFLESNTNVSNINVLSSGSKGSGSFEKSVEILTVNPIQPLVSTSSNTASTSVISSESLMESVASNISQEVTMPPTLPPVTDKNQVFDASFNTQDQSSTSVRNGLMQIEAMSVPGDALSFDTTVHGAEAIGGTTLTETVKTSQTETNTQVLVPVSTSKITEVRTVVSSSRNNSALSNLSAVSGSSSSLSQPSIEAKTMYPETTELSGPLAAKIARALQGGKSNERVIGTRSLTVTSSTTSQTLVPRTFRNSNNRKVVTSTVISSQPIERVFTVERNSGTQSQGIQSVGTNINDINASKTIDSVIQNSDQSWSGEHTPESTTFDVVQTSALNNGQKQNIFLLTQKKDLAQNNMFTSEAVAAATEVANTNNNNKAAVVQDVSAVVDNAAGFGTNEQLSQKPVSETVTIETSGISNTNLIPDPISELKVNSLQGNVVTSNEINISSSNFNIPSAGDPSQIASKSLNNKEGSMVVETTSTFKKVSEGQRQTPSQPRLELPEPAVASETKFASSASEIRPIVDQGTVDVKITVDKIVPSIDTSGKTTVVQSVKTSSFEENDLGSSGETLVVNTGSIESSSNTANFNVFEPTVSPFDSSKTTLGGSVVNFANGAVTKKVPTWKQKPFTPPDVAKGPGERNTFRTITVTKTSSTASNGNQGNPINLGLSLRSSNGLSSGFRPPSSQGSNSGIRTTRVGVQS